MEISGQKDGQIRSLLLAVARELLAQDADFSLKTLLLRTEVSRGDFRRCFADREELLAALSAEGMGSLEQILAAAQPAQTDMVMDYEMRAAVGSDFAPAPGPRGPAPAMPAEPAQAEGPSSEPGETLPLVNDAWLERRLRVFERALGSLEKRQEKAEEELAMRFAVIGERLDLLMHQAAQLSAAPAEPAKPLAQKVSAQEVGWNASFEKAQATGTEILEPATPDLFAETGDGQQTGGAQTEAAQAAPAQPARRQSDMTQALDETQTEAKPLEKQMIGDFVARGRKLALDAEARRQAAPPRPLINLRLLAIGAAALLTLIICAGALAASGVLSHSQPAPVVVRAGVSHRQEAANGLSRLMALADSGNASAQTVLALDYLRGENGVASNDGAAERWSKAAAEQGQPMAQYLLGALYQEDESSAGEAVRWFKAAAEQGNLKAMHNLAIAYAEGQGVDKDSSQAVEWFSRAAEQGYRDSEFDLAVLYERGDGVAQSARDALKWYMIAAARGDGPSAERAAILKKQVDPMEAKLAQADAAHFQLQPMGYFANEMPEPDSP